MNTCEPRKKPLFIYGFYDSSSELGHDHGHASSASCVGPRHASHDASIASSRAILLRNGSKDVSKMHLNQHLHHANPHDKLSASFRRVTKSWVPKYMLANPSGSKTRVSLSSHV
jgi:hypothetical protein